MNNPGAAKLVPLFRERATKANVPYPHVDTQVAGSFAAWQVLEAAVTATKSLDDKALGQWLRANRVPTIIGTLRFDGPNNYGDDLFKVKQVQDSKWVRGVAQGVRRAGRRAPAALIDSAAIA